MVRLTRLLPGALAVLALSIPLSLPSLVRAEPPKLKALLVTGGCCHDYPAQIKIVTDEISKRVPVEWTIVHGKNKRDIKRIFGTTLGHHNETMKTKVYLEMLTRGFLWACDQLDANGESKRSLKKKK